MKIFSRGNIKAGIDSVRNAKLRSFWTILGVIIGVASVITVVAIGEGIKQQVGNQINNLGQDTIIVRPAQLRTGSDSGNEGLNMISGLNITTPLSSKDVATVASTKGVNVSAPLTIALGIVDSVNGKYEDGFVIGTSADLDELINQPMAYGAFFSSEDNDANVAVLGQHAVDEMFDGDVPLGRSFTFHGERFIVRGIFEPFVSTPLSQQANFNNAIFIPNDVAERLTNESAATYSILASPSDPSQTQKAVANIRQALGKAHGSSNNFQVLSGTQNMAASDTILNLLTRLIAGVAAISLLVGGIGIMNVMLVSVAERMHEIGIRKAIGATNRQIMSQFMIESSALSLAGGLIGIVLAFVIDLGLRLTTNLQPSISWQVVAVATSVSLMVGIVFGTVPAVKAARKDPIEALRAQ